MDPTLLNELASELENAFRVAPDGYENPVSRSGFMVDLKAEIETGLEYLYAHGKLKAENVSRWSQEFDFGNRPLREVIADPIDTHRIRELISQVKGLKNTN